jgi:hypothetical protein
MKKTLLAGIAALSVLSASLAHSHDTVACMEVVPPSDIINGLAGPGYLNFRDKPSLNSKVIGKLGHGLILFNRDNGTLQLSKDWIYFDSVVSVGEEEDDVHIEEPSWRGWVRSKYLRSVKCPTIPSQQTKCYPKWLVGPGWC